MNTLDPNKVRALTRHTVTILKKDVTTSTNDDLKSLAAETEHTRPVVLFADKQTAGRGRQGRSFFSEGGLYMSVLFPTLGEEARYLTHVAAVAVGEAISAETGLPARVKWVNDVYMEGKKVCGILAESFEARGARRYVLGIGVNVGTPKGLLPEEIRSVAAFFDGDKSALAARILNVLFGLLQGFDLADLRARYAALSFLTGRRVNVLKEDKKPATVVGLSDGLGLLVRYDDGSIEELIAGEVHLIL